MERCLELAKLGAGFVAPNPMVGALLVYADRIIGEGWHQEYGKAHAEVNCIASVKEEDRKFISGSTLYVSLEPCAHFGKTPPCADLIILQKIPKIIIGCRDPFEAVNGKGIEKLRTAGVEVMLIGDEMEEKCKALNKRFFTFHTKKRPYVILKWAQTKDGFIASGNKKRLLISNDYSNRLVHQWRSEEAGVLIGTNTALLDNPELTTRLWPGNSPVRLVIDMDLKLPATLKIFNREIRTIIFNSIKQEESENLFYYKIAATTDFIKQLLTAFYTLGIQSVLVEGGAKLLQSFIDSGIWDETRIIVNEQLLVNEGLNGPIFYEAVKTMEEKLATDRIEFYSNSKIG